MGILENQIEQYIEDPTDRLLRSVGLIKCNGCGIYIVNGEYTTQDGKDYCMSCTNKLKETSQE